MGPPFYFLSNASVSFRFVHEFPPLCTHDIFRIYIYKTVTVSGEIRKLRNWQGLDFVSSIASVLLSCNDVFGNWITFLLSINQDTSIQKNFALIWIESKKRKKEGKKKKKFPYPPLVAVNLDDLVARNCLTRAGSRVTKVTIKTGCHNRARDLFAVETSAALTGPLKTPRTA